MATRSGPRAGFTRQATADGYDWPHLADLVVMIQGRSRMRQFRNHGSVEGVLGDWHSYSYCVDGRQLNKMGCTG